jgi:3'-5' exoribonuclease 1
MVPFKSPLIGPSTPTQLCPFDYILVIDFEATCEEPNPANYLHEIIEFPVVVVDVLMRRVSWEFHSFVRPVQKPKLSSFCTHLTGIRQEDVDAAPTLPEVIKRFENWYSNTIPPRARTIFATDGPWDMRDFMYLHSHKRCGVQFPPMFYRWIDVKAAFANFFRCSRSKIRTMLEYLGYSFEGRLHSGLDDSRNIAKIVIALLNRGCSLCDIDQIPYIGAPNCIDDT